MAQKTTTTTEQPINLTGVAIQPLSGELKPRMIWATDPATGKDKATDQPELKWGRPLYELAALTVLPLVGQVTINIRTNTPPAELVLTGATLDTRLAASGNASVLVAGADFRQLAITIWTEHLALISTATKRAEA